MLKIWIHKELQILQSQTSEDSNPFHGRQQLVDLDPLCFLRMDSGQPSTSENSMPSSPGCFIHCIFETAGCFVADWGYEGRKRSFSSQLCQTTGVHFILSAFSTSFPSQNLRFGRQAAQIHCTWYGTGSSCGAAKATWRGWLHPRGVLGPELVDLWGRKGFVVVVSVDSKSTRSKFQPVKCAKTGRLNRQPHIVARMRQPPPGCCH